MMLVKHILSGAGHILRHLLGFFRYKHVNSYWTHHADSHNVPYQSRQRTEHMSFKIKETDKCLHCLTWNLLPSIHSVCVWQKRPKDPSQCVSSSMPLPFIHHAQLGLTGKPTSWAWRSEVKQGEISRCRLLCSNTSAFQIHTHTHTLWLTNRKLYERGACEHDDRGYWCV